MSHLGVTLICRIAKPLRLSRRDQQDPTHRDCGRNNRGSH
jgi:hypothetical protein